MTEVVGLFATRMDAQRAIDSLDATGYDAEAVGYLDRRREDEYDVDAIDTGPTHQLVLADDLLEFIAAARRERELRELVGAAMPFINGHWFVVADVASSRTAAPLPDVPTEIAALAAWLAEHGEDE